MPADEPTKSESPDNSAAEEIRLEKITAEVTSQVITQVSKFFSGPLPPPEVLIEYNNAFPGAAERIVAMAEKQMAHRHALEDNALASNSRAELVGQIIGGVLSAIAIIGGIYLAAHDKPLSGFGVILVDVASLAGIFLYVRNAQTKERREKLEPFKQFTGPPKGN
jgi:uncharacterized membrane protein